jgi:uncharacterized repeat protein (TIGR01451 family)
MKNKHHIDVFSRIIGIFLLVLAVVMFTVSPTWAQGPSDGPCDNPVINEDHHMPEGGTPTRPIADFCASPRQGCDSVLVQFTDYTRGYVDTWAWDFGDPASGSDNYSNEENPSHLYRSTGVYAVTVTVTGPGGANIETKNKYITVRTLPVADFSFSMVEYCDSTVVSFHDLSTGYPNWWRWDFGDGTIVYAQNTTHVYTTPDTYLVTLKAMNDCGYDIVTKEVVIIVAAPPVADFAPDDTTACVDATVNFTDQSLRAASWLWDFGDGTTSTDVSPAHAYAAAGVYAVKLTVTNRCGQDDTVKVACVTINGRPVADFTSDVTEICGEGSVAFSDRSLYATSWLWDFGDGANSTDQHPTHGYATAGIYTVTLTVRNDCGEDQVSKLDYIRVVNDPVADFSASTTLVCVDTPVMFTDLSTFATLWRWDFGDGATSSERQPTHAYAVAGSYAVTLTVTNACGEDMETKPELITVLPKTMATFAALETTTCTGDTVEFRDSSIAAETWSWDFGDGTTSIDREPSHVYVRPGTYTVSLVVTNSCGSDEARRTEYITVFESPVADFDASGTRICRNTPVSFSDRSQNATTWHWEFGDGASSTEPNPTHTYATEGVYAVSLLVTNACGNDTEYRNNYITVVGDPVADFYASRTETCVGQVIGFIDSSQNAESWLWNFGDGATSTDSIVPHSYSVPGRYTVSLTVSNGCGSDMRTREYYITVAEPPLAAFTYEMAEGCEVGSITVSDDSRLATTWFWDFGDGTSSQLQNPGLHTYRAEGDYTVALTVTNPCGEDTYSTVIHAAASPKPSADFMTETPDVCAGSEVAFTDRSSLATSWRWEFGDGATSTLQHPRHTYATAGIYDVRLTVSNECGEDAEFKSQYLTVSALPIADFIAETTEGCAGATIVFTDQSSNATSWMWSFGDGTTSVDHSVEHIYTNPGRYTVSLTATNACGSDSETRTEYIVIHAGPTADFSAEPRSGTVPMSVSFTDLSTSAMGITSWSWSFGDGATSPDRNPLHTYTAVGTYTVSLHIVDACGEDTAMKIEYVKINDSCSVDVAAEPRSGCAPLAVAFSGLTRGTCEITAWTWDFGDPASGSQNVGSGRTPQHTYATAGTYTVTLTAVAEDGNKIVVKNDFISVYAAPTAAFDASPTEGVAPLSVSFTNQSQSAGGSVSWAWNFGDPASSSDNESTLENPGHIYQTEGTYSVALIVTNECGTDTATTTVVVSPGLSIVKAVDKQAANNGDELLYTLVVHNSSSEPVYAVEVVDTIPDSTVFAAGSITGGGDYDLSENLVKWSIPTIAEGSEVQLSFRVVIDGPFATLPAVIANAAIATIRDIPTLRASDRTFISNTVETVVDVPTGELGITKRVSATLASPGDRITYTITVTNGNPTSASSVLVSDAIPDSTTYVAGSISNGGSYSAANDSLTWNLGTLAAFSSRSVSFDVTIDANVVDGQRIPNTALVRSSLGGNESNEVVTAISLTPIVVTKTADRSSGMTGDLIRFTITIQNYSQDVFTDVRLVDTMPGGLYYVDGTSLLDGAAIADPTGKNPYEWSLGSLAAGGTLTVEYTGVISASAHPGMNQNVARARAHQGSVLIHSNRATADIYIASQTLSGSIRGRVVVDCDGDGMADAAMGPVGMDVYLDDGSQSRVNNEGMFYFSTVRPGERVVALDERDMEGYFIPESAQSSVFVHVHETGESYVTFRVCPEYPRLDIWKRASIVPTVKITKKAELNRERTADSAGATVDYEITIKSNGLADPTRVRVVDSLPGNAALILAEEQPLTPRQDGTRLVYEVTAAEERLKKSVHYSLRDLAPGERRFLTNKVRLEADLAQGDGAVKVVVSDPAEVMAGPFVLAPAKDLMVTLTPALFLTSKADLWPSAVPQLEEVADSIAKYADAIVKVEGHTDRRPIHTKEFPSNWELGEARAKAVVDWLVDNRGIDRRRLEYESFAATRPIVRTGATSEELQPNRRTEVIIKAQLAGLVDTSALAGRTWMDSTSVALKPVRFDTLFESAADNIETGLDDSWEIVLTVTNTSTVSAENVVISDVLPAGVEYVDASATVDGAGATATVSGTGLSIGLSRIEPRQKVELRYRIRALAGAIPTGGGQASVEVRTSDNMPIIEKSNDVSFR